MNNIEQIALYRLICYIEVPFRAYLTVCKAIVYDRNKNTLFTVLANIWKCTSCNRQNVESKCNSFEIWFVKNEIVIIFFTDFFWIPLYTLVLKKIKKNKIWLSYRNEGGVNQLENYCMIVV
jgi:hypothetical protein